MDTLVADLRYALRSLAKTPGFTAVAVLTLALGIGANTSVFTLVNAALYHTIAAPDPEELVWVAGTRIVLAAAVTRVASRFLYGVEATDLLTFMLCAVVLTAVAAAASFLPARRAASVDPMIALRSE
jgi:ABC-type lipoprotein release transport system permease subunit